MNSKRGDIDLKRGDIVIIWHKHNANVLVSKVLNKEWVAIQHSHGTALSLINTITCSFYDIPFQARRQNTDLDLDYQVSIIKHAT